MARTLPVRERPREVKHGETVWDMAKAAAFRYSEQWFWRSLWKTGHACPCVYARRQVLCPARETGGDSDAGEQEGVS
jgi:hypothetical protein